MAILAGAISISKGCRTDDRPIQLALFDAVLLTYVIRIRATQEEPKHDDLPEDIQATSLRGRLVKVQCVHADRL